VRRVLQGAGLLDIGIMGGGTGLRDGAHVASFSLISSGKLRGLLPLYAQPPMPTTSAGFIPQDYSAYVRLGFTSFSEGWQTLKGAVRGMAGEEAAEGIADFLEQFRENTGFDFEKDFLASLGGEVAVAAAVPEKLRIPDAVALLEVKDREKFEKMLPKLFPFQRIESETHEGVAIQSVQLGPLPAAYALVENYFVFGTDVSAVKSVVDARRSSVSLAANPAFRSAMAALGEGAHVGYFDIGSAMPLLLSAISRFATEWSDEAPDIESPTWVVMGKLLMSPLATNAVVAFCVSGNEQSVTHRGYATITGPYRMFATSGVMAGMLLPALMRARESAHRAACMNNLKQLAMAEKMYAADHDEKFSEKLSDLYPEYVNNFAVFLCPSHRGRSIASKEDIDEQTSYILRTGLTEASPADEVMIYEESWNHRGQGGNAAFVDGHVRWLGASELERLIEKDQGSAEQ
jgi:prepilin-type processing-associated H-X9-DG protein